MKISIKENGKKFTLIFPTAFLATKTGLRIAMKSAGRSVDKDRLAGQSRELREAIKICKKNFGNMELVHIESEDGSGVSITL